LPFPEALRVAVISMQKILRPYVKGRQLDLSQAAATQIGLTKDGVAKVKIEAKRPSAKQCTKVQRDAGKCRNASK
jgi:rare lipoprotein A (peptidoglycan hydrolase)